MPATAQNKPTTTPNKRKRAPARPAFDPERRAAILLAALGVFAEKGFHRATIRDIARAAQLAEGTIYNHFDNKTALITALLDQLQAQAKPSVGLAAEPLVAKHADLQRFMPQHFQQMLALHAGGGVSVLGVLLAELLTDAQLREAHAAKLFEPVFQAGSQAIEQWTAQGLLRSTRPEITARLMGAMLLGIQVQHMLGDAVVHQHWDELPQAMADLMLRGIAKK